MLCKPPLLTILFSLCYSTFKISARIVKQNKYPVRDARGTSPMTARQPPGEKGAKACTTGIYQSRDWYFCACFSGGNEK